MNLFLIDGIGPFFRHAKGRINWSKIPFGDLERDGQLDLERMRGIRHDFATLCAEVSRLGYTAITLDDVAHLATWSGYSSERRRLIEAYRHEWRQLFEVAEASGLDVFLTTDVMFYTPELERELGCSTRRIAAWMEGALAGILDDFPQVKGVILRFGECDGRDVEGAFHSRLALRSPRQLRSLMRRLLPVFEERDRTLVVRTWSVGAYHVGDLMWNRETFDQTFAGLDSPSLVLSMKHGESDFFRFLELNPHFLRSDHKKIVELQARREYEGFGEFPSFVGWELEELRGRLSEARNVIGASVWCQTGGWTRFKRLTFLDPEGYWNELNAATAIEVMRGASAEESIARFCERRGRPESSPALIDLLRLSDEVIRELLYIEPLARQQLFFRRLRVPPLLSVFWDNIVIHHGMRKVLRALVADGPTRIAEGEHALPKIRAMIELAEAAGAPRRDLEFQLDTFEVLAAARRYYFGEYREELRDDLIRLRDAYVRKHPGCYHVHLDFRPLRVSSAMMRRILGLLLRRKRGYRVFDRLVTLRILGLLYPALRPLSRRVTPSFAHDTAMGLDAVFR